MLYTSPWITFFSLSNTVSGLPSVGGYLPQMTNMLYNFKFFYNYKNKQKVQLQTAKSATAGSVAIPHQAFFITVEVRTHTHLQ